MAAEREVGRGDSVRGSDAKMRGDFIVGGFPIQGRYNPSYGGIKSSESALSPAGGFVPSGYENFNMVDYNEIDNQTLNNEINKLLNERD